MRWDILEKFDLLKKGSHSRAVKHFTGQEDFFREHFPGKPTMPEPLFIEMVAQAGGVLYGLGLEFKKEVILAKISSAQFLRPVAPPCAFVIEAKIDEEREDGAWISGTVKQSGEVVARVQLLLAAVDLVAQNGGPKKQIVFNEKFMEHFDIVNVARQSESLN